MSDRWDPQTQSTVRRGDRVGESFDSSAEVQRKKHMQEFMKEKGWDGIAGAAKAPRGAELERQFGEWRKKKYLTAGEQAAALQK